MHNGYKVFDSDIHIYEPADLWEKYIDPAFKYRAPRAISNEGFFTEAGPLIAVEGAVLPRPMRYNLEGGFAKSVEAQRYEEYAVQGFDSKSQLQAMDSEGVDVAAVFPSMGLYPLAVKWLSPDLATAIARAYNDWLTDFCSLDPHRLLGAALVPTQDPKAAAAEAHRAVKELGMKAIMLRPQLINEHPFHSPYYEPLWAAAEELGVPVCFHHALGGDLPQAGEQFDTRVLKGVVGHPLEMMQALTSIIGGGVLERFPTIRFGFLEANCAWAPWFLWRFDGYYELSGEQELPYLKAKPSDYFLEGRCFLSIEADEEMGKQAVDSLGDDYLVFSTDYPHPDSRFPHAVDTFLELPLSQKSKTKILWDNCARLYRLEG